MELKQQLLHSNTALVSPGSSDQQHSPVSPAPIIPHSQSVIQPYPHSTTPGNESIHYTPSSTAPQLQTPVKQHSSSPRQRTTDMGSQTLSLESSTRQENSNKELLGSKYMYLPSCSNEVSKETERQTDHVNDVRSEKEQNNIRHSNLDKKTAVSSSQASVPSNSRVSLAHIKSPPLKGHLQHDSKVHVLHDPQPCSIRTLRPPVS